MNKRQARIFALASTGVAVLAFLLLTLDSHRQFPKLTNEQNLTPQVVRGKDVWHKYNCINCHTIFGEGAYYAPDLTKIAQQRGEPYLRAYMRDPAKFYDEQRHRRLMPRQDLSETEITDLIAFLDWVSRVDNQGWPPRPILVAGSSLPGADLTIDQQKQVAAAPAGGKAPQAPAARPVQSQDNPIALGQAVFRSASPACMACHSVAPGVNLAGPSLAGVAARAQQILGSGGYKGRAKDVAGYIRESIVDPSAHLVPGDMYSANGVSFMPNTYGKSLQPDQVEQLVAYLTSLK
ncbi:cytochrome c [Chitiniphilus purpureus]|uniref:Cytochrome c n=1 Tax=Chitiniphilus purpureus TaxID=2981137 RepID=A0ABY6DRD9_9NEIS|nr:cytochrome c [Chitiniphilus sp. CD1]UXY16925.1 cytochrome c [Chitiniphilus sp. CD1]